MKKKLTNISEKCFLTGEQLEKNTSLRFALSPTREVVPDCYNKLAGIGFWVRPEKRILQLLVKSKKLYTYFGGEVFVDPKMSEVVKKLLTMKVLKQLSLARKAGLLVIGSDAIKGSFNTGKLCLVLSVKGSKNLTIDRNRDNNQVHYSSGLFTKLDFEEAINKKKRTIFRYFV